MHFVGVSVVSWHLYSLLVRPKNYDEIKNNESNKVIGQRDRQAHWGGRNVLESYRSGYSEQTTGWTIGGSNPGWSNRFVSSSPPSPLFYEYRGFIPEVSRPGRDVDHSPPSSAEAKNEWSYTSTPLICHHGVDRDNCMFLPIFLSSLALQITANIFFVAACEHVYGNFMT